MAVEMVPSAVDTYRRAETQPGPGMLSRREPTPGEKKVEERLADKVDISRVGRVLGTSGTEQAGAMELSEAEQRQVEELKRKDREVRAHEQAHVAAGGGLVRGGASFEYRAGPDGRLYAVGGEVTIDTSAVPNDPDATMRKAAQIRQAALAPANPSPQDRSVAAEASQMETRARAEKAQEAAGDSGGGFSVKMGAAAMAYSAPASLRSGSSLSDRAVNA